MCRMYTDGIQDCPTPRHGRCKLRVHDIGDIQNLDSNTLVAVVGVDVWLLRLPGTYLLETQIIPHEPHVPRRFHCHGGIHDLGHCVVY